MSTPFEKICSEIAQNKKDTLVLRGWRFSEDEMIAFLNLLSDNKSITSLCIIDQYNGLKEAALIALANVLKKNVTLKILSLRGNEKTLPNKMGLLTDALGKNRALKELDLSYNNLESDDAIALSKMLLENQCLESLELASNEFEDREINLLAGSLCSHPTINTITLGLNTFGVSGAKSLKQLLMHNKNITEMDLSRVDLEAESIRELTQLVSHNHSLIKFEAQWPPLEFLVCIHGFEKSNKAILASEDRLRLYTVLQLCAQKKIFNSGIINYLFNFICKPSQLQRKLKDHFYKKPTQTTNLKVLLENKYLNEISILVNGKDINYPEFYVTKLSVTDPRYPKLVLEKEEIYCICKFNISKKPSVNDIIISQVKAIPSKNGFILDFSITPPQYVNIYKVMIANLFTYLSHKLVTEQSISRIFVENPNVLSNLLGYVELLNLDFELPLNNEYQNFGKRQFIIADKRLPFAAAHFDTWTTLSLPESKVKNELVSTKEELEKLSHSVYEWINRCFACGEMIYKVRANYIFKHARQFGRTEEELVKCFKLTTEMSNLFESLPFSYEKHHSSNEIFENIIKLVNEGASPTFRSNSFPYDTVLSFACRKTGNAETIGGLLKKGASHSINMINAKRQTALMIAADIKNNYAVVKLLLSENADINCTDTNNFTALFMAAWNGDYKMVELLLKAGASQTILNSDGDTILNCVIKKRFDEFVDLNELLKAGLSCFVKDKKGRTPLHYVCAYNLFDKSNFVKSNIVQCLFSHGARKLLGEKDNDSKTPDMLSEESEFSDDFKKLLEM